MHWFKLAFFLTSSAEQHTSRMTFTCPWRLRGFLQPDLPRNLRAGKSLVVHLLPLHPPTLQVLYVIPVITTPPLGTRHLSFVQSHISFIPNLQPSFHLVILTSCTLWTWGREKYLFWDNYSKKSICFSWTYLLPVWQLGGKSPFWNSHSLRSVLFFSPFNLLLVKLNWK